MGRRYAIEQLAAEQQEFVVKKILDGYTDVEVSAAFESEFKKTLAKSSIGRWREAYGDQLARQYFFARVQAAKLLEDLGQEKGSDKLSAIFGNIEDRLLISAREIISENPLKLLQIRLDDEKRRQKDRELDLKERQLGIELAKAKAVDPAAMPAQVLEQLLEFIGDDTAGLRWFRQHSESLEQFLIGKYTQ